MDNQLNGKTEQEQLHITTKADTSHKHPSPLSKQALHPVHSDMQKNLCFA